jgi:DNA-binding NarL/FixJ family response regulator
MELLRQRRGVGYLLKDRVADITSSRPRAARRRGRLGARPHGRLTLVGRRRGRPARRPDPREREVLELMAEGRSNQAIAEKLVVTPRR